MRKIFIIITFAVLFTLLFIVSYKSCEARSQQIKNQNKTQIKNQIKKHSINEHLEEMVSIPKSTVDRWEATLTIMEQKLYNDMK